MRYGLVGTVLLLVLSAAGSSDAGVRFDGLASSYETMTVFASGPGETWRIGQSQTRAGFSMYGMGLDWRLRVSHTYPTGALTFGDPNGYFLRRAAGFEERLTGEVVPLTRATRAKLSAGAFQEQLRAILEYGYREAQGDDWMIGAGARFGDLLEGTVKRGVTHPEPASFAIYYEYEDGGSLERAGGRLDWSIPTWVTEVKLAATPARGLRLSSMIRDADMTPSAPSNDDGPGSYGAAIAGMFYDGTIRADYEWSDVWKLHGEYRHLRLEATAEGFDDGVPFAHFGVVSLDARSNVLGLSYKDCNFSAGWGSAEGEIKGSMELWPFVDGLVGLLGERRHVVAEGSASWKQIVAAVPVVRRAKFRLDTEVRGVRLEPRAVWTTWRPAAFGFGVDDLRTDQVDLIRADLARLLISPRVRLGAFDVAVDVSQWVPLSIGERGEEASGGGVGAGGDGGSAGGLWPGFSLSVRVQAGM